MPYDPDLARRLADLFGERTGFERKKMFGGIGWLLNGHLCAGVHKSWLIVRVGEETASRLLCEADIKPMDITGRPMKGWAMVAGEGSADDHRLRRYTDLAVRFVSSLPPKRPPGTLPDTRA